MSFLSVLWAIAFGICPQRPSHTLFFDGQPMPIEARMAGMFAGFLIGILYFIVIGRARAWRMPGNAMTILLVSFIMLLGTDGLNALLYDLRLPHLYPPNLPLRLGTGLLTGFAFAAFILPAFNSTLWRTGQNISPVTGVWDLLGGLTAEAVYFLAALSGWSAAFYPVSILAVLPVPLLLGATGAIVAAMVLRRANRAEKVADALPVILMGLALAVAALSLMGGARYLIFGPGPLELPIRFVQ